MGLKTSNMRIAVVGATGLVGQKMLKVLEERNFSVSELIPVASNASVGKLLEWKGRKWQVTSIDKAITMKAELALFSAGGNVSLQYAEAFAKEGTYVIDNSSAWRMHASVPLVVPEVNGGTLEQSNRIIANPNCSTIQLVMVLKPLHDAFGLKRVVVSTYQSVTGTGYKAVAQMEGERTGKPVPDPVYPYPIDLNCLPQCDVFAEEGYTKEEWKVVNESRKILGIPDLAVTATAVRIPTVGGHSESVNVEFEHPFELDKVRSILRNFSGIEVLDDPDLKQYPMPIIAHDKDEVFVGRIRRDFSQPNTLNCWIVADNLRKGAATNAVQIAELLLSKGWI